MPEPLPALNLVAQPGQRRATLEIAREIEQRGFAGISVSSQFSNMAQCMGLAFATERISFATAIAPIYAQTAEEFAQQAAYSPQAERLYSARQDKPNRFRASRGPSHQGGKRAAQLPVTNAPPRDRDVETAKGPGEDGGQVPLIRYRAR